MTGDRSDGSSAPAAALGVSSQLPWVQRAMTRPVGVGGLEQRARHLQRQLAQPLARGVRRGRLRAQQRHVVAQLRRARRQVLHLLQEQPARDLQAALGLELDALLDAGEDQRDRDDRHGDDRAEGRDDEDRGQPPPQAVPPHHRAHRQRPDAGAASQPLGGAEDARLAEVAARRPQAAQAAGRAPARSALRSPLPFGAALPVGPPFPSGAALPVRAHRACSAQR